MEECFLKAILLKQLLIVLLHEANKYNVQILMNREVSKN